jgi:hypothetical protein
VLILAIAGGLSGCVTTQQRNERARVRAERAIAGRGAVRVLHATPDVDVTAVTLLHGRTGAAVVVELRSRAATALTDLPISVGLRGHGRRLQLNAARGLGWFRTHVPAIAPGGRVTWVLHTRRALPAGLRAYAKVGAGRSTTRSLPRVDAAVIAGGRRARVRISNPTDIPQTPVEVFALSRSGGRVVGAGSTSVPRLDSGAHAVVDVPLVGSARGLTVQAAPTIFK